MTDQEQTIEKVEGEEIPTVTTEGFVKECICTIKHEGECASNEVEETRPVGRPSTFTQELADNICHELALGKSMRTVCKEENMPAMSSVFKWLRENKDFSEQYARAKQESADAMAEEILDIADESGNDWKTLEYTDGREYDVPNNEAIQRSRLRVDTRKWLMSKMKPKKYGDKMDVTSDGKAIKSNSIIFTEFSNETDGK